MQPAHPKCVGADVWTLIGITTLLSAGLVAASTAIIRWVASTAAASTVAIRWVVSAVASVTASAAVTTLWVAAQVEAGGKTYIARGEFEKAPSGIFLCFHFPVDGLGNLW